MEVAIGGQDVEPVVDEALPVVDSAEEDPEEEQHIRTPKVGTVIIDQLRQIDFEPYRLWQPPLDVPRPIDELVNRFLGHPWQENYGADGNLVFPVGSSTGRTSTTSRPGRSTCPDPGPTC